ncbi:putative Ig domain-containing protein [Ensifer sp. NPDC090286]|uniref:putative Ig domain-containing protein n=1 Tax=Ensifer sp. NPDC090286 TaxID=3363991 RepID=UPI00383B2510
MAVSIIFAALLVRGEKASVRIETACGHVFRVAATILLLVSSVLTLPDSARAASPPLITANPSNSTICAGANTSFSVTASNATSYQWQVDQGSGFTNINNSAPYAGSTTATLFITGATAGLNGYAYRAMAIGAATPDAESNPATLTVNSSPQVTGHPSASTIHAGGNTTFVATVANATGYQWQVDQGAGYTSITNNALYSGATSATLSITGATTGMNGYVYRVIAVGVCTPVTASYGAALTVTPPPTVTGVSPSSGPTGGGTSVILTGTDFTGVTAVTFGATPAASFTVNSSNQITATAPGHVSSTIDIRVTTLSGTSTTSAADQFTYVPPPTVTSVTPSAGPTAGGTTVIVTGTNFSGATAVTFGGTAAAGFTVDSANQITATAPAGTGTVDVRVTTVGGTSATSASDQFTYIPPPTVTSISPTSGPTAGGTTVILTGTNFSGATAVTFGATPAAGFTVISGTQITATAPANAAGTFDIRVTTVGGTSATSAADQYTYVAPPTVTSVTPTSGPMAGGTTVILTGTNFSGATAVTFGGTVASGFTVNSATQITVTSPAHFAGTVDIRVTTAGGTSATSAADQFTYVPSPTVTSVSPTNGSTAGGTSVVVTGTNFSGATAVTFGGTAATGFTVNSGSQITATAPASSAGTVDVRVITVGGTSATSAADQFTYVEPPVANAASATVAANSTANAIALNIAGGTADSVAIDAVATHGTASASGATITYTPTAGYSGTDSFTYTATNVAGTSTAATVTVTVTPPVLDLTPASTPNGVAGTPYSQTVSASGGTAPNTFTLIAGATPPGVSLDQSTGELAGTPTATGTFNFRIKATDHYGATGDRAYQITTVCPAVAFTPSSGTAFSGTTGVPYNQVFSASGTTGGSSFTFSSNVPLPSGLTFDPATNTLSGTPTQPGSLSFALDFTDVYGCPFTAYYSINVAFPAITLAPAANGLPGGETGVAYSQTISASGGSAPYTYALVGGLLPAGVTFDAATATLSGTPTAAGSSSFTITATDVYGAAVGVTYTLPITHPAVNLTPAAGALPGGTTGIAYSQSISASGGTAPYSYAATGTLPTGVTLDGATGTLSGTPTATGTSNFTVTATDAYGASSNAAYSLSVAFPSLAMTPVAGALPGATTGLAYSQTFSASGGSAPYNYAISVGILPSGLALDGATGTLSGTPTATGSASFTVTATDAYGASSNAAYSLTVAYPTIAVTPAAGALPGGTTETAYSQTISASGGTSPYSYAISGGLLPAGLTLDGATGAISGTPTTAGNSGFTITATDAYGASGAATYALTIVPSLQAPISNAVSTTVAANSSANAIPLQFSGDTPDSVAVASAPSHGTANASGTTINYTPTAGYSGPDSFTYTATNAAGTSTAATVSITVTAPAFTFSPAAGTLASAMAGEDYRQQITALGGRAPMLYSIASGTLPRGMVLNVSTGELTGPLDAASEGDYTFTIRAEDSNRATGSATYGLKVTPRQTTVSDQIVDVPAGSTPADVYLNRGATGGPFTDAELTFVEPANAGKATIIRGQLAQAGPVGTPIGWYLQFTPNPGFSGRAKVGFRLTSALGASNTGTVTYNLGFAAAQVAEDIDGLVRGFVSTRQNLISESIFVPGLLERRRMGGATDPVTARMTPSEDGMTGNLSTSLAQLDAARDSADGITGAQLRAFNAWIDLAFLAHNRDENDSQWGSFAMLNVGADYLVSKKALIGLSFHFDRMTDPTDADAELTGNGWLFGPNASLELGKGVFWDTSLLYGGSSNDIDTTFWDGTFDTTRWMVDTAIKGQWSLDEATVLTPKLRAVYFSETVDDYTVHNSAGDKITIDGFDEEQFRVSLGAEVERSFTLDNGSTLTPKLGATAGYSGLDGSGVFGNLTAGVSLSTADLWLLDFGLLFDIEEDGQKSVGGRARASRQF